MMHFEVKRAVFFTACDFFTLDYTLIHAVSKCINYIWVCCSFKLQIIVKWQLPNKFISIALLISMEIHFEYAKENSKLENASKTN